MFNLLLRNVRCIDPARGVDCTGDLAIRDGIIVDASAASGLPVRDATGLIVAPGFWDIHVHFRDPGNPAAETRRSGACAAAAGGFTHVVPMPNTTPAGDSVEWLCEQLADDLPVTLHPSACITSGREGGRVSDMETLAAHGACAFTDDGATVADDAVMLEAMRRAKALGKPIFDHAVVPSIAHDGVIRDCPIARALHLPVFPPEAETEAIARDIRLCRETGCTLVIQHLSTAGGVALIRAAQAEGLPVFAEASPHHLALAAEDIPDDDGNWRMNPPLGSRADREALRAAVLDGTISIFATDHAPHAPATKSNGFLAAPFGVIGLETAIGVTWQAMVVEERMAPLEWVRRWTTGPAAALGMPAPTLAPGTPADLVLIDPATPWTVAPDQFLSRSRNCPFAGRTLSARAVQTLRGNTADAPAPTKGRVGRWQQKLLDLSLRNRLLNVRDTRQVVTLACADIATLEDKIALNQTVALDALEKLLAERGIPATQHGGETDERQRDLLASELVKHRLWSPLAPAELYRRLTEIFRQSRTDIEEGGVNTLFLAVGFLEWKKEGRAFLAPILLIPVRLTRKSVQGGFAIERIDEEPAINVTLLEMLRREFDVTVAGLDPLPQDEAGVDVTGVMRIFRQAFKDMPGWDVREEARLGLFSFNKFIMWTDLTSRLDALRSHPVISHLLGGGGMFDDGIEVFDPAALEQHLDVRRLFCPVNADASQLAAVMYSAMGKSFVLHGPPGTGKSQTITNIIAHNLALGRRVLFVSEKRAALDVVHKRLSAVGLGPFCLELHSNKTAKGDVLKQFAEVLAIADAAPPADWDATAAQWLALRDALNAYAESLHTPYPNGLAAHHCLSRLIKDGDEPAVQLPDIDFLSQSRDALLALRDCAARLTGAFTNVTAETREAFAFMKPIEWRPTLQDALAVDTQRVLDALDDARGASAELAQHLGLSPAPVTRGGLERTGALCEALRAAEPNFPPAELLSCGLSAAAERLHHGIADGRALDALTAQLASFNTGRVMELDCKGIAQRLSERLDRFILIRFFLDRALLKELQGLKKTGAPKLTIRELAENLPRFRDYTATRQRHESQRPELQAHFGPLWRDTPDWAKLDATLAHAEKIHAALLAVCETPQEAAAAAATLSDPALRAKADRFLQASSALGDAFLAFDAQYGLPDSDDTEHIAQALCNLLAHLRDARRALIWKQHRHESCAAGLANWATALERGAFTPEAADASLERAVCRTMADQILATNKTLRDFMGDTHDARIRNFRDYDTRLMRLSQNIIRARLTAALPRARRGDCPDGTELGLLKRECAKRMRQRPVRNLLAAIPALLPSLKPCFLMSPLSVAQYLPADMPSFDLLVFDEASQIPVWDAIGAIARARQVIVIGDPKQMPPTNFFQRGDGDDPGDDPDTDIPEDLESILDECLAAGLHSCTLDWHYRSRHESLIAFSNHHYYGGRLHTFPAATDAPHLGVRARFVEGGTYDRTQTRTNPKEAAAVVEHLARHFSDPATRGKSVGVVTFSQAQKDLIEDLLDKEAARNPQLEASLDDAREEPLFVKNLENVQGDERDVILFSVGYAPDKDGRFYMNFGPLNRQGGERRLNVAITRAKEQVTVFASITASQIDPARTAATGALHLKHFLDYAEHGGTQTTAATAADAPQGEAFPTAVAQFLTASGHRIETHVGHSSCRIDIAVAHPDKPGHHLLGIECDGPGYIIPRFVRDRDRLRHDVLAQLGWTMRRLWAADWYHDRARAEHALLQLLDSARAGTLPPPPPPAAVPAHTPEPEPAEDDMPPSIAFNAPAYKKWSAPLKRQQAFFYMPEAIPFIREQINAIIRTEAPIYEKLLRRRLVEHWGFTRAGSNIQAILTAALPPAVTTTLTPDGESVFWSDACRPETLSGYRVPGDPDTRRNTDEIPPEEIAQAMLDVIAHYHTSKEDILFRETVRLFGFTKLTDAMRPALQHALPLLRQRGHS